MPSFVVYGSNGVPDKLSYYQVGLAEYSFSKTRKRCNKCGKKIRGKNHDAHCQPKTSVNKGW